MPEFDVQQAKIGEVEKKAGEKKHESLEQKLKTNRDLFSGEVDKAEKALADALKTLISKDAKDALRADQEKIRGFLKQVADKGRSILEGKGDNVEDIGKMAGDLRAAIDNAQKNIPLYQDVDKAKAAMNKVVPAIKKIYELRDKGSANIEKDMDKATDSVLGDLQEAKNLFDKYSRDSLPPELQKLYDAAIKPIDTKIDELIKIREAHTDIKGKTEKLQTVEQYLNNDALSKHQKMASGLKDKMLKEKDLPSEQMKTINDSMGENSDKAITELCKVKREIASLDRSEITTDQQKKYDEIVKKLVDYLQEMTSIQLLFRNRKLIDQINKNGIEYIKIEIKAINGQNVAAVIFTEKFKQLPPNEQQQIEISLKSVPFGLAIDVLERTAMPDDKQWIEGKQKFEKGDRIGAKLLLLDYLSKFDGRPEKMPQVSSAKSLLQGILKMDLDQVKEHFGLIQQTIEGRGAHGDLQKLRGVSDQYQRIKIVQDFINQAEEMMTKGEAFTIEEVYKKLPKLKDSIDLKSDGISLLDPFEQQQLLNEADPAKRRQNVLRLARAAKAKELTALAAKYYEMYFQNRIDGAKKSISRDKIKAEIIDKALHDETTRKQVESQIKTFQTQARHKFMEEYYKEHPNARKPAISINDPDVKAMKAAEANYKKSYEAKKGNVYQSAIDFLTDISCNKEAKLQIHNGVEAITRSGSGMTPTEDELIWKEAYGKTTGNVENITGEHLVFTQDDFYELQNKMAGSILTMEIATLAAMTVATGLSTALAGGAVVGTGGGTAGFLTEGMVMHSVTSYLNEGKVDPTSPEFLRGLASMYATLGIMKATGLGAGVKLGGKKTAAATETAAAKTATTVAAETATTSAIEAAATEAMTTSAVGAAAKGGAEFLGKVTLDSVLMTGLSTLEQGVLDKKWSSFDEMAGAFGNNAVTFFVIGGLHKVAEGGAEIEGKKLSKERKLEIAAIEKSVKAEIAADKAREAAFEGRTKSDIAKNAAIKAGKGKPYLAAPEVLMDHIGLAEKARALENEAKNAEGRAKMADFALKEATKKAKAAERDTEAAETTEKSAKESSTMKIITEDVQKGKTLPGIGEVELTEGRTIKANPAEAKTIKQESIKTTTKESPGQISYELILKLHRTTDSLTPAEQAVITMALEGKKIDSTIVVNLVRAGRMALSEKLAKQILDQNPFDGIKLCRDLNYTLDPETQVKTVKQLMASKGSLEAVIDLVRSGYLDLEKPQVLSTLLGTADGLNIVLDAILQRRLKLNQAILDKLLSSSSENGVVFLENFFLKDSSRAADVHPDLGFAQMRQQIEKHRKFLDDCSDLHWEIAARPKKISTDLKESIERIEHGKAEPEGVLLDGIITRLRERDSYGYQLLKNNIDGLNANYLQAITQGSKIEFIDTNGKKIIAYEGAMLGEGSMGTVSGVAFTVDGGTKLQFAVIKKPHSHQQSVFLEEAQSAKLVQSWNDPHINMALHISDDCIIYESGPKAKDLDSALKTMRLKEALSTVKAIIEGILVYQKKGYFHGDLKEKNVIVFDGKHGVQTQIIDNSPNLGSMIKTDSGKGWIHTPGYLDYSIPLLIKTDPNVDFHAIDNYAIGTIVRNIGKQFNVEKLYRLADQLQDLSKSGKADFLSSLLPIVDSMIVKGSDATTSSKSAIDLGFQPTEH